MFYKIIKFSLVALILWLGYLTYAIYSFPQGSLDDKADVAIVLGAAVTQNRPSPVFEERIRHAINLYQRGKISKLIFTGGVGENKKVAESVAAKVYAIEAKVATKDIYTETHSLTTRENLIFAKQILDQFKIKNSLIISDSLHLKRAMKMATDLGINAKDSATPTSRYQSFKKKIPFALRELYFYHHYLLFSE